MNLKFNADETQLEIDIDRENECHNIAVWNDNHWNVFILTNAQLEELKRFLNNN